MPSLEYAYSLFYFLLDVNECNDTSTCGEDQVCFNIAGSYLCECDYGYEHDPNSMLISPGVYRGCKGVFALVFYLNITKLRAHFYTFVYVTV